VRADFPVFLDACVLVPMPLADLLLRLAEEPRMYTPKWSHRVLDEVSRALERNRRMSPEKIQRRRQVLLDHFPEALTEDFESLETVVSNHAGDRHILAAAIKAGAQQIVTYNQKHFPSESLVPWNISAVSPDDFLLDLCDLDPDTFLGRLSVQAQDIEQSLPWLLERLARNAPSLAQHVAPLLGITLP